MSRVIIVKDDDDFAGRMADALKNESKVVVDFNATWCGPCKAIAPLFATMSQKYTTVTFLSVDIDKCKGTATALKVSSIPTFHFSLGNTLMKTQVGASKAKLEENVKLLAESDREQLLKQVVESGEVAEGEAEKIGEHDLSDSLDLGRSEALNDTPSHPYTNVFKADETFCESDTDEQLLFTIAFRKISSIKTLKFIAPEDGSGPKKIKIFLNKANMGFSETEEFTASQTLTLTEKDLKPDTPAISLDYARFVKTDTLTIFIESNQKNVASTKLTRLIIWGKKPA